MSTIDQLRGIFEQVFNEKLAGFGPDLTPAEVENWDSTTHVSLVLAIEQHFSIAFTPAELGKLDSVGAIAAILDTKLALPHATDRPDQPRIRSIRGGDPNGA
jgi:acyl carrier protein